MNYFLAISLVLVLQLQYNFVYPYEENNKTIEIEHVFNMECTLGTIFCAKLNNTVYKAVLDKKISAYRTYNIKPEEKIDIENILDKWDEDNTVFKTDTNFNSEILIDTVIRNVFSIAYINSYFFSINWELNQDNYSYYGTPTAFSFAYITSTNRTPVKMSSLFWISFSDLKIILTPDNFRKLQEALFLHLFRKIQIPNRYSYGNDMDIHEINKISTNEYFFNNRLYTDMDQTYYRDMNKNIYDNAIAGKIVVYNSDSLGYGSALTKEKLGFKIIFERANTIKDILDTNKLLDAIVRIPFNSDSIKGNSVSELWEMDYLNNRIVGKITGISINREFIFENMNLGLQPLFFVPYDYIATLLGKTDQLLLSKLLFQSLINNYLR